MFGLSVLRQGLRWINNGKVGTISCMGLMSGGQTRLIWGCTLFIMRLYMQWAWKQTIKTKQYIHSFVSSSPHGLIHSSASMIDRPYALSKSFDKLINSSCSFEERPIRALSPSSLLPSPRLKSHPYPPHEQSETLSVCSHVPRCIVLCFHVL